VRAKMKKLIAEMQGEVRRLQMLLRLKLAQKICFAVYNAICEFMHELPNQIFDFYFRLFVGYVPKVVAKALEEARTR